MRSIRFGMLWVVVANLACSSTNHRPNAAANVVAEKPVEKKEAVEVVEKLPPEDPDAVYQMRQMHLSEWIDKAKRDCERTKSTDAWLPERDGFLPEEIELVKTKCADAVEVGLRGDAWIQAMSACARRFAQTNGTGKHECRLSANQVPEVPPELFDRHRNACTESCARAGAEEIESIKERARFVHCCDGTTSPSCTYGSLHKGCCSGHQGVCIE